MKNVKCMSFYVKGQHFRISLKIFRLAQTVNFSRKKCKIKTLDRGRPSPTLLEPSRGDDEYFLLFVKYPALLIFSGAFGGLRGKFPKFPNLGSPPRFTEREIT